ncbi:hypothetical protein [Myxococcus sp. CA040A]|uniref:hypothetical protein n=1 Tax=Myxococcus sp. CA040A TaxID=2741738 RepID=UPI001C2DB470|nr:hypothetical protein [Myxococcus sp. CA040A]NTX09027.1 hypothetical protein [Myxococcus sp. CA040A]
MLASALMRLFPGLLSLALLLSACDRRTEEEKRLEAKRVAFVNDANEHESDPDLRFEAGGRNHTTFIRIEPFGSDSPTEVRAEMLKSMELYEGGRNIYEEEGWTHVGFRDRGTGIELLKPVAELRTREDDLKLKAQQKAEKQRQQSLPSQ